MSTYLEVCEHILTRHGPLLGGELARHLSEVTGVTAGNARQIIRRLKEKGLVRSTDPVGFGNNQFVYFLSGQGLADKLKQVCATQRQQFFRLYQAFLDLDGFLLWQQFAKILGAPLESGQQHRRPSVENVFNQLRGLGLVAECTDYNRTKVVIASTTWVPNVDASLSRILQRIEDARLERQMTGDLLAWLERINFAGTNATHSPLEGEAYQGVNSYYWDAYGFSYLWGLYSTKEADEAFQPAKSKTGSMVLVESVLTRTMRAYDVGGFIARVNAQYKRLTGASANFRYLPVCFARNVDKDALLLARSRGIMVVTLAEVFGTRIFDAIDKVRRIDLRTGDPRSLVEAFETVKEAGQEGKVSSLKGYLFNVLVALFLNAYGWSTRIGVQYRVGDEECECDIVASTGNSSTLLVCECKGYHRDKNVALGESPTEYDSVRRFFERTMRIVRDANKSRQYEALPVFVTSGGFADEAREYLDKLQQSRRLARLISELPHTWPSQIWYDYKSLRDLFTTKQEFSPYKRILDEHFKDP